MHSLQVDVLTCWLLLGMVARPARPSCGIPAAVHTDAPRASSLRSPASAPSAPATRCLSGTTCRRNTWTWPSPSCRRLEPRPWCPPPVRPPWFLLPAPVACMEGKRNMGRGHEINNQTMEVTLKYYAATKGECDNRNTTAGFLSLSIVTLILISRRERTLRKKHLNERHI